MKKALSRIILCILFLGLILPMSDSLAAPTANDSLVILHPHSSDFASHVIDAFKTWYTADTGNTITVETSSKYSGDCYADVVAWNGTAPEADVWWGGGEYYFAQAQALDLLQRYEVEEDANIADYLGGWHLKDDSDTTLEPAWYAAALSGFGIIYNTEYLTAEGLDTPDTWSDLTDFQYFGHISMCDPDLSGSTVAIVKQVLAEMSDQNSATELTMEADITDAWEYWVQVSGNVGTFTTGSSAVPTAVTEGNAGIGLCIDYYALDKMEANANIGFTYGGATTVSPDPAGIIKGATNIDPAKKFMDFLTGTAGQSLVGDYRTPANFKATSASHVPLAFDTTGTPTTGFPVITPFNPSIDGAIHSRAEILFTNWIVQNHDKLKVAWEEINGLPDGTKKDDALAALIKLPSDFDGTMGGLQGLDYKNSTVTDNWKDEGVTNFDEALEIAGATSTPGFEVLVLLISFVVLIPLFRKKK